MLQWRKGFNLDKQYSAPAFVMCYQTVNTLWKLLVWQVCSSSNIRIRRYLRTTDGRQIRAGTHTRRSRFATMVAWKPGYNPWIMMLYEAISCMLNVVHKDLRISLPCRLHQGMSRLIILMIYSGYWESIWQSVEVNRKCGDILKSCKFLHNTIFRYLLLITTFLMHVYDYVHG